MNATALLEDLRSLMYPGYHPTLDERGVAIVQSAIEEIERQRDALSEAMEMRRDAARYRAIRGLITYILEDEAGIQGIAFNYQIPIATMQSASEEELLDAVADVAAAMDAEEAPK